MYLFSATIFSALYIPVFYLLVGWLSTSRFVNLEATNVGDALNQEKLAGRESGRWRFLKPIAVVFVAATVLLGCVGLLAWLHADAMSLLLLSADWFLFFALVAFQLNPQQRGWQVPAALAFATALVAVHATWPANWVVSVTNGTLFLVAALLAWRTIRLPLLCVLSAGLFFYDITHVYGTGLMEYVAASGGATSSVMMTIPQTMAVAAEPAYQVGLGDIMIPGLWVLVAFRVAAASGQRAVIATTIIGIILAWGATIATLELTEHAVPALLFLMPGAALGYFAAALLLRLYEKRAAAPA